MQITVAFSHPSLVLFFKEKMDNLTTVLEATASPGKAAVRSRQGS